MSELDERGGKEKNDESSSRLERASKLKNWRTKVSKKNASGNLILNADATTSARNENVETEPRVHGSSASGPVSILATLSAMSKFGGKQEASTSTSDKSTLMNDSTVASTISTVQRSILRDKVNGTDGYSEYGKISRIRQLLTRNPPKGKKKTIIFVDEGRSEDSLESIVTMIGTSRPLKSALRGNDSLRSGTSSSVRFSIPPEPTDVREDTRQTTIAIGKLKLVCEITNDVNSDTWIAIFKSLNRTRLCKIIMCFTFGIIVPSFLIVPVLVYEEDTYETAI